jgi:hypothetical protein
MKVQCPSCKRLICETTAAYNPDVRPNSRMIRLLKPWRQWHPGDGYMSSDLECPNCCAPLAPSGRLRVVPDDYKTLQIVTLSQRNQSVIDEEFPAEEEPDPTSDNHQYVCPVCGKPCKSGLGLHSHMRSHA